MADCWRKTGIPVSLTAVRWKSGGLRRSAGEAGSTLTSAPVSTRNRARDALSTMKNRRLLAVVETVAATTGPRAGFPTNYKASCNGGLRHRNVDGTSTGQWEGLRQYDVANVCGLRSESQIAVGCDDEVGDYAARRQKPP